MLPLNSIDIGSPAEIHPTNKQDVGLRLGLAARAVAYGENIEYSGPLFCHATQEGGALGVWFDHAAGLKGKVEFAHRVRGGRCGSPI